MVPLRRQAHLDSTRITSRLRLKKNVQELLLPKINERVIKYFSMGSVSSVKNQLTIKSAFLEFFPEAHIEIGWDLLAAARALCGTEPGIA